MVVDHANSRQPSVLLVEEGWHSTMYLASALEEAGFAVTVVTANGSTARYQRGNVLWRSGPPIGSDRFLPAIEPLITHADHVLPLTEAAMARLRDGPWGDRVFPRITSWQQRLVGDKHALIEHMATRGIAIPRHRTLDALDDAIRELGLPLVIKGSTGSAGKLVRIVETREAAVETAHRARALGGSWIVQELVASPTYLIGGVFHEGRPLRIYAAEKLELYPPRTGGAIHVRSTHDAALIASGLAVMRELRWTGFASADFVRRDDGYLLLEVNPRLWGSLAGALSAGVDLFAPFIDLLRGSPPIPCLSFTAADECLIFPRYLYSAGHRNLAGIRQAIRDLGGVQGRDWRDLSFVIHILRRLYRLRRDAARL